MNHRPAHPRLSLRAPRRSFLLLLLPAFALLPFLAPGCAHTPAPAPPRAGEQGDAGPAPRPAGSYTTDADAFTVQLEYVQTTGVQEVITREELLVSSRELGLRRLPPGTWRVSARQTGDPEFVYPVYVKAFKHNETGALHAAREEWRAKGYTPSVTTLGRAIAGADGTLHDNRKYWLAVKRCTSQAAADALKAELRNQKTWSWSRELLIKPAPGIVTFRSTLDQSVLHAKTPVVLRSEAHLALPGARKGQPPLEVPGPVEIRFDRDGHTAFVGELPLETYLRGVLPAEMYPSWPHEALKAQAVAARSEVLVHAAGKHDFDGFDFCIGQHCRVFGGRAQFHARTDQAVRDTAGLILVQGDQSIVPTVFSSNCGGWTEHNENVWDGEAEAALRGRPDSAARAGARNNAAAWVDRRRDAFCAGDPDYYRWTRTISRARLSAQFNRDYGIGTLRAIEPLERGVSGRVKSVRIAGDRKSAVIEKELNIRRAFDNLPSALCTFSVQGGNVVIKGAGRGHGVGLCQHGAHGMARNNHSYNDILRHYFTGARISRL